MTPTPREIEAFFSGMEHSLKQCDKRGYVSRDKIQRELTTLRLRKDALISKGVIAFGCNDKVVEDLKFKKRPGLFQFFRKHHIRLRRGKVARRMGVGEDNPGRVVKQSGDHDMFGVGYCSGYPTL